MRASLARASHWKRCCALALSDIRNAKVGSSILLVSTISLSKVTCAETLAKKRVVLCCGDRAGLVLRVQHDRSSDHSVPRRGRDDVLRLSKMSHECASARPTWGHNVWQP